MFRRAIRKIYYLSENQLHVSEIRWFRLKIVGTIVGAIVICLALLLGADRFYYSFLGLGDRKTETIM